MVTNPRVDKILYILASLGSQFYSESTRTWAKQIVDKSEGTNIKEVNSEEVREIESTPDGSLMYSHDNMRIKLLSGNERQRGLTALVIAMKYRLKQYSIIILAPVVLYLITADGGQTISLRNVGIYFDLFGAIIVVRGLYRTPNEIDFQSRLIIPGPVGNLEDKLMAAVETVDSMFGSTLLALGFSLQLLAASGILFTSAAMLLVLIVWLGIR